MWYFSVCKCGCPMAYCGPTRGDVCIECVGSKAERRVGVMRGESCTMDGYLIKRRPVTADAYGIRYIPITVDARNGPRMRQRV